jgi:hypothetical protein
MFSLVSSPGVFAQDVRVTANLRRIKTCTVSLLGFKGNKTLTDRTDIDGDKVLLCQKV